MGSNDDNDSKGEPMSVVVSKTKPAKWGRYLALMMVLVAVAAGCFLYEHLEMQAAESVALQAAAQRPGRTQVHALGRLEPAGTILQLAPKSGNEGAIVEQILVSEGDDVAAGAVVAVLDNRARRIAAVQEAQAHVDAAEARLQQTRAGAKAGEIEAQQAAVLLAEAQGKVAARELDRARKLLEKNAIASEMIDQKQWEFDRLQLEQRRASGLLKSLREVRDVDLAVAGKEIAAANAACAKAQADADASELRAPIAGRILRIHTHPGEKIADRGILEMGDVLHMQAVAEVFEADVAMITVGMPAEIRMDSSDVRMKGHVVEIGNMVSRKIVLTNDPVSDTDARVIEVRVELDADWLPSVSRLSNARVEVTIRLEQPKNNLDLSASH